jgi:NitT/TauT family transport system substrate-binding protein
MNTHTMNRRVIGWLVFVSLVVISLAGSIHAEVPAPLNPPEKVAVAYVPIMKFAALYVAAERGLFTKYGLDVQIERVKSGTEVIAFLTQGTIELGGIAIVASTWNAWGQGIDMRIIAPAALEPLKGSPTKLLVRKGLVDEGKVKTVADLKGLIVAMAGGPGSGGEYLAAKGLERGGLTITDVETVNVGNADMPAAFENGSIDAGLLAAPYADQVIAAGTAVSIAEDLTPGAMTVAFVGSSKLINARPEVAKRFVLALMEAARLMQGAAYLAPENVAAYLAYVNTTEDALRKGDPVIYDPNQRIALDGLKDIERVHRQNGRVEYKEPIDLSKVVTTTFVDEALTILGAAK